MSQKWAAFQKEVACSNQAEITPLIYLLCTLNLKSKTIYVFNRDSHVCNSGFFLGHFVSIEQQCFMVTAGAFDILGNHSQPDFQNPILCSSHFSTVKKWALLIVMSIHELFG